MKTRRVQTDELKKMKQAIFIWRVFKSDIWAFAVVSFEHVNNRITAVGLRDLTATQSLEEAMLKVMCMFPEEKVFVTDDIFPEKEDICFCSPFRFIDMLGMNCVVHEVTT